MNDIIGKNNLKDNSITYRDYYSIEKNSYKNPKNLSKNQ
jgi:hypothetical protein